MPVGMNLASRVHGNLPGKSLRSAKDTLRSAEILAGASFMRAGFAKVLPIR